jgi:dipeptidyl aminopeptidase/acylaminoacyl peptidase
MLAVSATPLVVAAQAPAAASSPVSQAERQKQAAEIEKQLADLQKKLAELKGEKPAGPKAIEIADMATWKSIRGVAVSNNGEWFAYRVGPAEGDGEVIVKQAKGSKEHKFAAGGGGGPSGVPAALAAFLGGGGSFSFSHDSKWFLFSVNPPSRPSPAAGAAAGGAAAGAAATGPKTVLLNLATGEKVEYEGIRRATFSGESATHLALHKNPAAGAPSDPNALPAGTPPQIAAMLGRTVAPERSGGSDLVLRDLTTGNEFTIGSVSEFAFDKKGRVLVACIDSPGQTGNGIQLRNLATGVQTSIESGKASYSKMNWTEDGEAFTCLKSIDDKEFEGKLGSLVAFKNITAATPEKVIYDPTKDTAFPKGMTISSNYTPHWSEEKSAIYFGIQELKKKGEGTAASNIAAVTGAPDRGRNDPDFDDFQERRAPGASTAQPAAERPDLILWHWKDTRMQSMQALQASTDRSFTYLCVYQVNEKKVIRLADESVRLVSAPAKGKWALGRDVLPYQRMSNLDGRQFQDVYAIDTTTGEKKKVLTQNRWLMGTSHDSQHFLYYDDGHFFTYEFATGKSYKITADTPASFVDTEDDHNVQKPPTRPMGWSKDGQWVLISDNWDIWKLPVHGGPGVNLTVDGKKDGIRYQGRIRIDPEEKGVDLSVPQYVSAMGERTKKSGFVRIDPNGVGGKQLIWEDAALGAFVKPKNADLAFFTKETHKNPTDWYVTDLAFGSPTKLTNAFPDQSKYLWSRDARLVDYTSKNGDKLQAALYLPANYEKGKSYPTIVYIYEHLSDSLNRYTQPTANGFNKAYYTSHGYAVLMPDINYKINDPGMSAVACVLPALDAAIATGVVDKNRVGLHGHSWGGYQTAFLVTQTNAFKAAVAGAPLTNLISMYSSVYWNTGSANQPIFESSQGRFTSGYWDNLEAYARNSPVYHAKNVQTPLIILHNDKDGAVDFNQGVEYFNTLRRLDKPVIMIQYKGENHGVVKNANRKDYTVRMKEFFDHYLMNKPAPDWLKDGIPHLKMEEHLKARSGK